jgi:hypothetical protein
MIDKGGKPPQGDRQRGPGNRDMDAAITHEQKRTLIEQYLQENGVRSLAPYWVESYVRALSQDDITDQLFFKEFEWMLGILQKNGRLLEMVQRVPFLVFYVRYLFMKREAESGKGILQRLLEVARSNDGRGGQGRSGLKVGEVYRYLIPLLLRKYLASDEEFFQAFLRKFRLTEQKIDAKLEWLKKEGYARWIPVSPVYGDPKRKGIDKQTKIQLSHKKPEKF